VSAPHIILASLPSFCQKLSKLVEIWRSSDKTILHSFFWDTLYTTIYPPSEPTLWHGDWETSSVVIYSQVNDRAIWQPDWPFNWSWVLFQKGKVHYLNHPLADLEVTYALHLYLIGNPVYDFVFVIIELFFASSYCWDVTGGNLSTWVIFEGDGSLRSPILGGRGRRPPTTVGWQKTRRIALSCGIKISPVGSLD